MQRCRRPLVLAPRLLRALSSSSAAAPAAAAAASTPAATTVSELLAQHGLPESAASPAADMAGLERTLRFLKALEVPDLPKAVARDPQLLERDPSLSRPHLDYLLALGISDVGPVVGRVPQLLSCDVTEDLHRKVAILRALGVQRTGRWVQRNPWIVHLDAEADMRPSIEYLRSIDNLDVAKVVDALPSVVFAGSQPGALRATVAYLVDELGIPAWSIGTVINRCPQLLACNLAASIQPKVAWLRSAGFQQVERVVSKNPQLLTRSVETLEAKLAYLTAVWGRSVEQVEVFPQALTYSLEHLHRRHSFLRACGKAEQHKLHRILRTADYLFAKKLAGRTVEEYQAFEPPPLPEPGAPPLEVPPIDSLAGQPPPTEEVTAGDKYYIRQLAALERDIGLADAVTATRERIDKFFAEPEPDANADADSSPSPAPGGDAL